MGYVGVAIGWVGILLGILKVGMGLLVAINELEHASRYLGDKTSGEAIDQGVIYFCVGLGLLLLGQIQISLSRKA